MIDKVGERACVRACMHACAVRPSVRSVPLRPYVRACVCACAAAYARMYVTSGGTRVATEERSASCCVLVETVSAYSVVHNCSASSVLRRVVYRSSSWLPRMYCGLREVCSAGRCTRYIRCLLSRCELPTWVGWGGAGTTDATAANESPHNAHHVPCDCTIGNVQCDCTIGNVQWYVFISFSRFF